MIKYENFTYELAEKFNDLVDEEIDSCSILGFFDFLREFRLYEKGPDGDIIGKYAFCVFDDDIPVGFISCETYPDKKGITCQIMPVAVFKDYRRKGYGTKMVNGMKKGPFINEKVTCFSAIVHKENKAGLEFFKKNGFKKDKKRDSEILMKCFMK